VRGTKDHISNNALEKSNSRVEVLKQRLERAIFMENTAKLTNRMISLRSVTLLLCFGVCMEPCFCTAQVSMMVGPQSTSGSGGQAVYGDQSGSSSLGIGGAMPGMGGLSPVGGYGAVGSSTVPSTIQNGLSARVAGVAKRINAEVNGSADSSSGMLPSAATDGSASSFAGHRSRRAKQSTGLPRGIAGCGTKTYEASGCSTVNVPYQSEPIAPHYERESWLGSSIH
jgi:hypothetical protein